MLSFIRDKLKTWVVVMLVILVAIPLVFLGVGDYGTNQEQYALKDIFKNLTHQRGKGQYFSRDK